MKKTNFRLKLLMLLYTSVILVFLVSLGAVWTKNYIENKKENVSSHFVVKNLAYDIDDVTKQVPESAMMFDHFDDVNKTCYFSGLKSFTQSLTTLNIPSTYTYNATTYTVIGVDTTSVNASNSYSPYGLASSDHHEMTTLFYNGSRLTALIIPDSVEYIAPNSLYGLASLLYLKTPFIGDNKDSRNPIHSMFSLGFSKITDASYQYPFMALVSNDYNTTSANHTKVATMVEWYDNVKTYITRYWVPSELEKVVVTKQETIGNRTFIGMNMLKEVELPDTLTSYDKGAVTQPEQQQTQTTAEYGYTFAECTSLQRVVLSQNMATLPIGMFSNCQAIEEVIIPKNTSGLPKNFFGGCTNLHTVYMPTGIDQIGSLAFSNCEHLTKIQLYQATKECIEENYVRSETDIGLPSGLKKIEQEAFSGCLAIQTMIIPASVTSIGHSVFNSMTSLKALTVPFIGSNVDDTSETAVLGYFFGSSGNSAVYNQIQNAVSYSFPQSLTTVNVINATYIGPQAFANLSESKSIGVKTITINDGVTYIADGSFAGIQTLTDLVIPFAGSGTNGASGRNTALVSIFGTQNKEGLENQNGRQVPISLSNIQITHQDYIYGGTFNYLKYIKSVEIGKFTTEIAEGIFFQNDSLESLVLPFVGIYRGTFNPAWWWWRDKAWRNQVAWVFSSANHSETYPCDTLRYYDGYRKWIPNSLKNLTITDESYIDYYSFRNLSSLETLTIKQGRTVTIAEGCAYGLSNLKKLSLPFLGSEANRNAASRYSATIGYIFGTEEYNNSYSAAGYGNFQVPKTLAEITIDNLTAVTAHSFRNLSSVTTITFNEAVNSIYDYAFYGCKNLTTINYKTGTNFKSVGNYAFYDCQKINDIRSVIPRYTLTDTTDIELGDYSFARTSIPGVDFTKLAKVGKYAFSGCLNIRDVNVTSNVTLGEGTFADCTQLSSFTLAQGKAVPHMFENCISLENADIKVATSLDNIIPAYMFAGCTSLKWGGVDASGSGLLISNQTVEIGEGAFKDCIDLDKFVIPSNTKKIGNKAFLGITKYDSVVIPAQVTSIGTEVFTTNIGHDFKIWVYDDEEYWPTGWTNNWNCVNPVYVIPGIDDSIYTFAFSAVFNGYIITGIKSEFQGTLTGKVNIPAKHNAVDIIGIETGVFEKESVTKIVVPRALTKFVYSASNEANPFATKGRVDLYFEATRAQALEEFAFMTKVGDVYMLDNDPEFGHTFEVGTYEETGSEDKLIDQGFVFYKDQWAYGTANAEDAVTPYIKLASMDFVVDDASGIQYYDGTQHKPGVGAAYLQCVVVDPTPTETLKWGELPIELFIFTYQDNVFAGTAKINASLNTTKYNEYKKNNKNQLLFAGEGRTTFIINKSPIKVYYTEETLTHQKEYSKTYDENRWERSASTWGNAELIGLPDGYTISGYIETTSANAGTYDSFSGGFRWSDKYVIRNTSGVDVTSNYTVDLFLKVTIDPMPVHIVWDEDYQTYNQAGYYEYQYTGEVIKPKAKVLDINNQLVERCRATAINIQGEGYLPSSTTYRGFAYIDKSNTNYTLQSYEGEYNNIKGVFQDYKIVKRKLTIYIQDQNYVMGKDDNSYIFDDWGRTGYYQITGLQEGSYIDGRIITVATDAHVTAADEGEVYWATAGNPSVVFEDQVFILANYKIKEGDQGQYQGSITPTLPWLIYRYEPNGDNKDLIRIENDYYDVEIDSRTHIKINYNQFDLKYYMDDTEEVTLNATSTAGQYTARYETDGEEHDFTVQVLNSILEGDTQYTIEYLYYKDGEEYHGPIPPTIQALGEYRIGIRITRKNFTEDFKVIDLNAVKSNVKYDENVLNKEYDGKPLSLFDEDGNDIFITKRAKQVYDAIHDEWVWPQTFTYEWGKRDSHGTWISLGTDPTNGPITPGKYYLHITATESDFFNALDTIIEFEIQKRKLFVYVDRVDPFDPTSTAVTYYEYNGAPYTVTINTSLEGASRGRLLGMQYDPEHDNNDTRHVFVGTFQTRSQYPMTYKSSEYNDFVWTAQWQVYETNPQYGGNVTSFYQVVFVDDLLISPKPIVWSIEEPYDGLYDGNTHALNITVTDPATPSLYKIYYSLEEINATNDSENAAWSLSNPMFVIPGTYQIWFKIEAGPIPGANEESEYRFYYETVYGTRTITIRELTFEIEPPLDFIEDIAENAKTPYYINYNGHNHSLECTVTNNPFAVVYYSLTYASTYGGAEIPKFTNSTDVLFVSEPGFYTLTVRATGDNFEDKTVVYKFRITEEFLYEIPSVTCQEVNVVYDGNEHYIDVVVSGIEFDDPIESATERYKIAYRIDGSGDWVYDLPVFTDVCEHVIYYRVEPIFDVNQTKNYRIATGSQKIVILPATINPEEVTITSYEDVYDGEEHTITVNGLDLVKYNGARVYYATTYEVTLLPVTNSAWLTTPPTYKDVTDTRVVYVRIVLPNYNDYAGFGTVKINKLLNPTATYKDLNEIEYAQIDQSGHATMFIEAADNTTKYFNASKKIEYSKASLQYSQLNVKTSHDGNVVVRYYNATKLASGEYTYDEADILIDPPTALGNYYFIAEYKETINCKKMIVQGGFDIVPKVLRIIYTEENEYNGEEQGPAPTVVTGTPDTLYVLAERTDGNPKAPIEIGEYEYEFKFSENQTNYEIHPDDKKIIYKITKRKLNVEFTETKEYEVDVPWSREKDWTAENGYAFVNKLLTGHTFHARMYTSSYAKATYVFSSLSTEPTLYDVKVYDVYITDAEGNDVTYLYDISYNIVVMIVYPTLDYTVTGFDGYYDGLRHGIEFHFKDSDVGLVTVYYLGDDEVYHTTPISYEEAGTYTIKYWITSYVYQDVYGEKSITIKKTTLQFDVLNTEAQYEDYEIHATYNVSNVYNMTPADEHIHYYKKSDVTYEKLNDLYTLFGPDNALYTSVYEKKHLDAMRDAGEYYIVVYYANDKNWYESFTIVDGLVTQRPIYFTLSAARSPYVINYDGHKYDEIYHKIALGNATYNIYDLVPNHSMKMSSRVGTTDNFTVSSLYTVRTVSANAGQYYGTHYVDAFGTVYESHGFEFDRMVILDSEKNDVTANYCPIFDDSQLVVMINRIALPYFNVTDAEYEYDGKNAMPNIDTLSDGELTFRYFQKIGENLYEVQEASNVGEYIVKVRIAAGSNYNAWPDEEEAVVRIIPKVVNVVWEDNVQTFDGHYLKPTAYFKNIYDEEIPLDVMVWYEDEFNTQGAIKSNLYEADVNMELFYDTNYELQNVITIFTIQIRYFDIYVDEETTVSDAVWRKYFNETLFEEQGIPDGLTIRSHTGSGDDAYLTTIDSNGGTYQGNNKFEVKALVKNSFGIDCTDSVEFNIIGKVIINSHNIIYKLIDTDSSNTVTIDYDTTEHYISSYINVLNPSRDKVTILYSTDGGQHFSEQSPKFKNVGTYNVSLKFTATDYDEVTGNITLKINQVESYINFKKETEVSLNKVYDGIEVTREKVLSTILNGEWNGIGTHDDLDVTFYHQGIPTPLTSNPVNAGVYEVVITCNKDNVLELDEWAYPQNYTFLNVSRVFEIERVVGEISFTIDKIINNEAAWYESGNTISFLNGSINTDGILQVDDAQYTQTANNVTVTNYNTNNFNSDQLVFSITIPAATAYRGTSYFIDLHTPTITFDPYMVSTNKAVIDTTSDNTQHSQGHVEWNVFSSTLKNEDGTKFLDMTSNYTLSMNITLRVHLPYANIVIPNISQNYNGDPAFASVDWANSTPSAAPYGYSFYCATNSTDLKNRIDSVTQTELVNNKDIVAIDRTLPGTTTVYYHFDLGTDYESFEGYYTITINKFDRDYTFTVADREYDQETYIGKKNEVSGYYIPDFVDNTTYVLGDAPDILDRMIVKYQKSGSSAIRNEVKDAGYYTYWVTIPETENFKEVTYVGHFTISRRKMYLSNISTGYQATYTGQAISYNDFSASNINYKIYIIKGNDVVDVTNTDLYISSTTIKTSGNLFGEYSGANTSGNTVSFVVNNNRSYNIYRLKSPTDIENVTSNYELLLSGNTQYDIKPATITINKGVFTYEIQGQLQTYNGYMLYPEVVVKAPLNDPLTTIEYSADGENWSTSKVGFVDARDIPYQVYARIKNVNYVQADITIDFRIQRKQIELSFDIQDKTYDGKEVEYPTEFVTNLPPEAQSRVTQYNEDTWTYLIWSWNSDKSKWMWVDCDRPINAGLYRLVIEVDDDTAGSNYKGGQFFDEFTIEKVASQIEWDQDIFTYDAHSQIPAATLANIKNQEKFVYSYTIPKQIVNGDPTSTKVGTYEVTVTLAYEGQRGGRDKPEDNYDIDATTFTVTYQILPRPVTIKIRRTVKFDDGSPFQFNYNEKNDNQVIIGFYALGLVYEDTGASTDIKHTLDGTKLYTADGSVGIKDKSSMFTWSSSRGQTYCIKNESNNVDETDNYSVTLDLYVNVDFSQIETNHIVQDYVYDKDEKRFIKAQVANNGTGFKFEYFAIQSAPLTGDDQTSPMYNVEQLGKQYQVFDPDDPNLGFTDVGVYYIYLRVSHPSGEYGDPKYERVRFEITKKELNLQKKDTFKPLDKPYDGVKIQNPQLIYADMEDHPLEFSYRYYEWNGFDWNTEPLNDSPVHAGKYKLIIEVKDPNSYKNYSYTPIEETIIITKRELTFTFRTVDIQTKPFDNKKWSIAANNSQIQVDGLTTFDTVSGTIRTVDTKAQLYNKSSMFESTLTIVHSQYGTTTNDYTVSYKLNVRIEEATILYSANDLEIDYDAKPHNIPLQVTEPTAGYTVEFSLDGINYEKKADFAGITSTGVYTVYFKISAENYATISGERVLKIRGVITPINVDYEANHIFDGQQYPEPIVNTNSKGTITITYYDEDNAVIERPTNVGDYTFKVHIAAYEGYDENETTRQFHITKKAIDLEYDNLEFTYDGEVHCPTTATYTDVSGNPVIVNIDTNTFGQVDAGKYSVKAVVTDTNYLASNPEVVFTIKKQKVEVPDISQNMEFTYKFSGTYTVFDEELQEYVEKEFSYGDDIVVTDRDGRIYILDNNGEVLAIKVLDPLSEVEQNLPYLIIIDTNKNAGTHTLRIHIKDENANNYEWDLTDEDLRSKDVEIDYEIKPYELTTNTLLNPEVLLQFTLATIDYQEEADYYQIYDDGNEIKLGVFADLKNSEGVIIKRLQLTAIDPNKPEYQITGYTNNKEISTKANKALIHVEGINNFKFNEDVDFMITTAPPDLISLKSESTVEFIKVEYINNKVVVDETNVIERTQPYQSDIYLGRMHQTWTKAYILSQFENSDHIKIFKPDKEGKYPESNELKKDTDIVGTNYLIVLYNDSWVEIDSIKAILYGDLTGDGNINAQDVAVGVSINNKVFTGDMIYYYAALTTRKLTTPNPQTLALLINFIQYKTDPNADYNNSFLTKR